MNIRTLRSDEIDCRVQQVKPDGSGCCVLLYKDARCDMRILDEVFGITGWQRSHDVVNGNLFCTVEIWDPEKSIWIKKQDVGTESNTEKEKGEASDSFKRACFNIGIGRELYSSPFIWIPLSYGESYKKGDKSYLGAGVKFSVSHIGYNDHREIVSLQIVDTKGNERYSMRPSKSQSQSVPANTQSNEVPASTTPTSQHTENYQQFLTQIALMTDAQSANDLVSRMPAFSLSDFEKYDSRLIFLGKLKELNLMTDKSTKKIIPKPTLL